MDKNYFFQIINQSRLTGDELEDYEIVLKDLLDDFFSQWAHPDMAYGEIKTILDSVRDRAIANIKKEQA